MKPILFIDFDGTLCHDKFWRSLPENDRNRIQKFLFEENTELVNDWMLGKYTSEEINQHLAKELFLGYESLWETFVLDCRMMYFDLKVLERIVKLRDRFYTVLITDNMDSLERFTMPAYQFSDYFDEIVNSYNVGYFKNDFDGKMFKVVAENSNAEISSSRFIDNSVRNCATFEKLGGTSYLATQEKPLLYWLDILIQDKN